MRTNASERPPGIQSGTRRDLHARGHRCQRRRSRRIPPPERSAQLRPLAADPNSCVRCQAVSVPRAAPTASMPPPSAFWFWACVINPCTTDPAIRIGSSPRSSPGDGHRALRQSTNDPQAAWAASNAGAAWSLQRVRAEALLGDRAGRAARCGIRFRISSSFRPLRLAASVFAIG